MRRVILIVFDSVRQDHVSCYGYGRKTTPNIDRMVEGGSYFLGNVPKPLPPLTPSVAYAMLTGQSEVILHKNHGPPDSQSLQYHARNSLIGSNHLLFVSSLNWDKGWTYEYLPEMWPRIFVPCRHLVAWFAFAHRKKEIDFSVLWFNETHSAYQADASCHTFMDDSLPTVSGEIVHYDPGFWKLAGGKPDFRQHMAYYDGAIHNLDNAIAPILQNISSDTLVMVCSDHGDWFGEFGHWFTHGWAGAAENMPAADDIRRPIMMTMSEPSPYNGGPATVLDIAPTVGAWLGIPPKVQWTGRSLLGDSGR